MDKMPIKNPSGKICGWIKIENNGNKVATDAGGLILGYYKASTNTTTDAGGRILARGDAVSSLIKIDL